VVPERTPSLQLEVAHIDSRQWAITARGFNNTLANKMLVLIDGRTVYTPLYAGSIGTVQGHAARRYRSHRSHQRTGATQWGANA